MIPKASGELTVGQSNARSKEAVEHLPKLFAPQTCSRLRDLAEYALNKNFVNNLSRKFEATFVFESSGPSGIPIPIN